MSMSALGLGPPPSSAPPPPISGRDYLIKLHKYLSSNIAKLAPPRAAKPSDAGWLAQSYTLLTLGLDPNSAPLSRAVKVPLTLGFGTPAPQQARPVKPVLLRLPPDKLLYLLLRWQSLPQGLKHVGRTDVPVPEGITPAVKGARDGGRYEGDVESVRSWVGSIRSVSSRVPSGWWGRAEVVNEDKLLLELYTVFNALPGLLVHPPFATDAPVSELLDAGGYTSIGGVDVRVPLDVMRNLQMLELDGFDPRGLLVPPNALLHSLTVHDVSDGDEWIVELLVDLPDAPPAPSPDLLAVPDSSGARPKPSRTTSGHSAMSAGSLLSASPEPQTPRFPNLRHLSLSRTGLLSFPTLPLTSVTHLDLSHNLLNAIPSLSGLHNLVSLNLSNNYITSVRNAPSSLGNVTTINLSHNRIDCLVGLDRLLGLKRVDVRANELPEAGEVGRLAVLPQIEGVWAAENPLTAPSPDGTVPDWRVDVYAFFASEGTEIVLDGAALSWAEGRRVDAQLAARGKRRPRTHSTATAPASAAPTAPSSPTRAHAHAHPPVSGTGLDIPSSGATGTAGVAGGLAPPSPARAGARSPTQRSPGPANSTKGKSARRSKSPSPSGAMSPGAMSPGAMSPILSPTRRSPALPDDVFGVVSPAPTPGKKGKRRAKRRVVNLDGDDKNAGKANGN